MPDTASGILIVDKHTGCTSHDIVNRIRRLYHAKSVGHTGTLDPDASGVLILLIGRAVKASEYIIAQNKSYQCDFRLGITTDTEDISGQILTQSNAVPDRESVLRAAKSFIGKSEQVPPMYSALKMNGKKLCDLARRGISIERSARPIEIFCMEIHPLGTEQPPRDYQMQLCVSKGTYIRSLCRDIGAKLGCGATMLGLRRTQSGNFSLGQAATMEEIEAMSDAERLKCLIPTEELFADFARVTVEGRPYSLLKDGAPVAASRLGISGEEGTKYRVYDSKGFWALANIVNDNYNGQTIPSLKILKQFRLD